MLRRSSITRTPFKPHSSETRFSSFSQVKGKGKKAKALRPKKRQIGRAELKWSKQVRERDGYACQYPACDVAYKSIDTHHIAPRSRRPDLKLEIANGISLCRRHHNHVHMNPVESTAMGLLDNRTYELAMKENHG